MNEQLLDGLNSLVTHVQLLDPIARFLASGGLYVLALLAAVLGVRELASSRERGVRIAVAAVLALVMALVCVQLTAHWVHETRPFVSDPDTIQLLPHAADNSFPSDHATAGAAIAVVAALAWPRWSVVFLVTAGLLGLARVMAGLHYPGDVLAGWTLGGLSGLAGWLLAMRPALPGRLRPSRATTRRSTSKAKETME